MIKITGLYKSVSKKGETFLSGKSLDGIKYFVFKNNKAKDTHPDYNLYMEGDENLTPKPNNIKPENVQNIVEVDDDLPF